MRIGHGYDIHRLVTGRKLMLGGVEIPYHKGLEGHSDADVVIHAICDAILGALGLGDIGTHFPDTDAAYKDHDSRLFLRVMMSLLTEKGYQISNLDITIIAQAPKLHAFKDAMREAISQDLGLARDQINMKATTNEAMGHLGRNEGIAAHCVTLLLSC